MSSRGLACNIILSFVSTLFRGIDTVWETKDSTIPA